MGALLRAGCSARAAGRGGAAGSPPAPTQAAVPPLAARPASPARRSPRCPSRRSLDYPGVGPEHSFLQEIGRAEYFAVTGAWVPGRRGWRLRTAAPWPPRPALASCRRGAAPIPGRRALRLPARHPPDPPAPRPCAPAPPPDDEALGAFQLVSRLEGIIPALETSHALAYLDKLAPAVSERGGSRPAELLRWVAGRLFGGPPAQAGARGERLQGLHRPWWSDRLAGCAACSPACTSWRPRRGAGQGVPRPAGGAARARLPARLFRGSAPTPPAPSTPPPHPAPGARRHAHRGQLQRPRRQGCHGAAGGPRRGSRGRPAACGASAWLGTSAACCGALASHAQPCSPQPRPWSPHPPALRTRPSTCRTWRAARTCTSEQPLLASGAARPARPPCGDIAPLPRRRSAAAACCC